MENGVESDLDAPNVRIIERAEVPQRPSRPKALLDLTLGVFAGLVLALGAAFARDYFDTSVRSNEEVEELLQLPTLATIPNFGLAANPAPARLLLARTRARNGGAPADPLSRAAGGGGELLVVHEPWSRVAEAFRSMRTAVLFSVPGAPPKVILSPRPSPKGGRAWSWSTQISAIRAATWRSGWRTTAVSRTTWPVPGSSRA